jgi:hypothetical protein
MAWAGFNDVSTFTPAQRTTLQQFDAYLVGWTSLQHKEDGSHAALTADTVVATTTVTAKQFFRTNATAAQGEWTTVPYASGNFTASAGTWTVESGDQVALGYMLHGKTMALTFRLDTTSTSAGMGVELRIAVPGGYTVGSTTAQYINTIYVNDAGTKGLGQAFAVAGNTYVSLYRLDEAAWGSGAVNTTAVRGTIFFEVA